MGLARPSVAAAGPVCQTLGRACRFLAGSSDSDSDDARRVVKSAKDRRFEELRGTTDEIRVRTWHLQPLGPVCSSTS